MLKERLETTTALIMVQETGIVAEQEGDFAAWARFPGGAGFTSLQIDCARVPSNSECNDELSTTCQNLFLPYRTTYSWPT